MKPNINLLKALIEECRWRDKVSQLFGPEWDGDGAQLLNYFWELCYQRWGEYGMDAIGEFISTGSVKFYDSINTSRMAVTIEGLYYALETYFITEKENEV